MSVPNRLIAAALLLTTAACSKSEKPAADSTAANTSAGTPTLAATPNEVTVTAKDFAFEAPDQIPAGTTTIRLVNQGKELHHVQIIKFDQGKTLSDFLNALKAGGPLPAWATEVGGPNAPAPGAEANATVTLDPGSYAFVCFVDIPDHVPHVMKGMSHPFTVTQAKSSAAEPTADVTMTLSDYDFGLSRPLTAGPHTIRVENAGGQAHEVELVQLDSGKTVDDVLKWVASPKGPPPGRPLGGIAGLAKGRHGFFTTQLTPGEYGLICFIPDIKDGKPHFMYGMKKQLKVS